MGSTNEIFTELHDKGNRFITCITNGADGVRIQEPDKICKENESWSPPHLFLSSVETCFWLTASSIAEKMRIKIKGYSSKSKATISSEDGKHREISEIIIYPKFDLEDEKDNHKIPMLIEKANEYCLIERSVKCRIKVVL